MNRIRPFAFVAALALLLPTAALPQTQTPPRPADAATERLLALLEKTGYTYRKVADGIWIVTLEGKNVKEIDVSIQTAGGTVVLQAKLMDRKAATGKPELLLKLLELNHEYDDVKLAISPEMLYARADFHARLLDAEHLKYLINQLAALVDEAEPQIKPFFNVK